MAVIKVSEQDFETKVIKASLPVVVDFYAEWCGPCRAAAPVIEELAKEYQEKLVIAQVDVDANSELAGKYRVMSIPTVIFFKNGKETDRLIGFGGKDKYVEAIQRNL